MRLLQVTQGCSLRAPEPASAVKKLVIKHAEYGTGDKWADVTAKIAAAVKDDRITQDVSFKAMGKDPAPGMAKRIKVTYTLDGQEGNAEVPDNQTLSIPAEIDNAYRFRHAGRRSWRWSVPFLPRRCRPPCRPSGKRKPPLPHGGNPFGAAAVPSTFPPVKIRAGKTRTPHRAVAIPDGGHVRRQLALVGERPDGHRSWRGQFHMEMVWWHLAHYALWDRWDMGDKAIDCYRRFAPAARELAAQLGYKGLKWQKSVGPEGRTAPWVGNQVLLWKQPHPIFFAELEYRLRPTRATLDKWADIVQGTAEHMADYPTKDEKTGVYHLWPVMPPSELGITRDTVFDLAYWRWGLDKAQEWRQRMGLARERALGRGAS